MEVERIYNKLDSLGEHISTIKAQNARMEVAMENYLEVMKQVRLDVAHAHERLTVIERDAARHRGMVIATSTIFGAISSVLIAALRVIFKA